MQQRTVEKQSYASGLPMGSAAKLSCKRNRSGGASDSQYNISERVDRFAWKHSGCSACKTKFTDDGHPVFGGGMLLRCMT